MRKLILSILFVAAINSHAAEKSAEDDAVLFYVDDAAVTESLFKQYYAHKGYQIPADREQQKIQQNKVANEVINIFLLSKQAEAEKLEEDYHVQQALEVARKTTLSKVLITRYLKKMEISDADREKAYQALQEAAKQRLEFKARYITTDDEKTALDAIKKLKKGQDFNIVAAEYSVENFTNKDDSKLGWLSLQSQEKEIAEEIKSLEIGKYSAKPVKTRFGWHVIMLDDKKLPEIPPLSEIKQKLDSLVQQQKLAQEVAKLRQQATIKTPEKK